MVFFSNDLLIFKYFLLVFSLIIKKKSFHWFSSETFHWPSAKLFIGLFCDTFCWHPSESSDWNSSLACQWDGPYLNEHCVRVWFRILQILWSMFRSKGTSSDPSSSFYFFIFRKRQEVIGWLVDWLIHRWVNGRWRDGCIDEWMGGW